MIGSSMALGVVPGTDRVVLLFRIAWGAIGAIVGVVGQGTADMNFVPVVYRICRLPEMPTVAMGCGCCLCWTWRSVVRLSLTCIKSSVVNRSNLLLEGSCVLESGQNSVHAVLLVARETLQHHSPYATYNWRKRPKPKTHQYWQVQKQMMFIRRRQGREGIAVSSLNSSGLSYLLQFGSGVSAALCCTFWGSATCPYMHI